MSTHSNLSKLDITKAIVDSGTTGNLMPSESKVINIQKSTIPIEVKQPAGYIIKSTKTGQLPTKDLPLEVRKVHIFTYLKHVLVSNGLFCDNRYLDIFDERKVRIIDKKTKKMIIRGGRDPLTKLFMLDINGNELTEKEIKPSPMLETFSANSVYKSSSK